MRWADGAEDGSCGGALALWTAGGARGGGLEEIFGPRWALVGLLLPWHALMSALACGWYLIYVIAHWAWRSGLAPWGGVCPRARGSLRALGGPGCLGLAFRVGAVFFCFPNTISPWTCLAHISPPTTVHMTQTQTGKKKLSGYMVFAKEMRPKVVEENPDFTFGEVGKELGKRWRALSDEAKEEYKAKG